MMEKISLRVNKDNILEFKNRNLTNYIIEEFVDYKKEISVIVAKKQQQMIFYPPVENIHKDSILKTNNLSSKFKYKFI